MSEDKKLIPVSNYTAAERAYKKAAKTIDAASQRLANVPQDLVDIGSATGQQRVLFNGDDMVVLSADKHTAPHDRSGSGAAGATGEPKLSPGLAALSKAATTASPFSRMLTNHISETVDELRQADAASSASEAGKIGMLEVAHSISKAELALQETIEIRNAVINAWKEIQNIPL